MRPNKQAPGTTNLLAGASNGWLPCTLTWYDPALGGTNSGTGAANPHAPTASGEPYDPNALTCAAPPGFAFGTVLSFSYGKNSVTVRVNDRGGAIQGTHFDLSRAAAQALGIINAGRVQASYMVSGSPGSPPAAPANNPPQSSGGPGGGGGSSIGSILDLINAPIDTIGGWLAGIAVNIAKDVVIGIVDVVVIPAWHWNQRAVMKYQTDMFDDKTGKQLLWTALFWGGGYWLLFTDPDQGNLAPASVRGSRIARHARFAQSLPARKSLIKPKDVKGKTPKKPKPVTSRAVITSTGTMATSRHERVRVTGNHVGDSTESRTNIEGEGSLPTDNGSKETRTRPLPHAPDRAGSRSLPHSRRGSEGNPGTSRNGGGKS